MKRIKSTFGMALIIGAMLMSAACGTKEAPGAGESVGATNTPMATSTPSPVSMREVAFGTEFEITTDERVGVGGQDVVFYVKNLSDESTEQNLRVHVACALISGAREHHCQGTYIGETTLLAVDPSADYPVHVLAVDGETLTVRIDASYPEKEVLDLGAIAGDTYTTTKQEYAASENFELFLDAGVTVPTDILERFERCLEEVEAELGMRVNNDSPFSGYRSNDTLEWLFGYGAFSSHAQDPGREMIRVYVTDIEGSGGWWMREIVLSPGKADFLIGENEFPDSDGMQVLEFLVNIVIAANGRSAGRVINSGYARLVAETIGSELGEEMASGIETAALTVNGDNARAFFESAKGNESGFTRYFVRYLLENYGEEAYERILKDAEALRPNEFTLDPDEQKIADVITKNTKDTFFEDFGAWFYEEVEEIRKDVDDWEIE